MSLRISCRGVGTFSFLRLSKTIGYKYTAGFSILRAMERYAFDCMIFRWLDGNAVCADDERAVLLY